MPESFRPPIDFLGETPMSRRRLLAALAAAGLSSSVLLGIVARESAGSSVSGAKAAYLCLIVLDGFRPDYFNLAAMPAVEALASRGMRYERAWVGQLESETPVGHATLATGALPRHNGVIGFEWRDPTTRLEVLDGWEQGSMLGQIGRDMHRAHAHSIAEAIKAADPAATVVALSSEKVYAADAMGASAADYVLYHRFGGLYPSSSKHALHPAGLPGQTPGAAFFTDPRLHLALPLRHFSDWDTLSAELALASFREFRPKALMVNLPGTDVYGHKFGGPAAPAIMARVIQGQDRAIARIVDLYREAGIHDQTLFVVTADHGMIPNHHAVGPSRVRAAVESAGARYLFHTGGTASYIYLRDGDRPRAARVAQVMSHVPGVVSAYFRTSTDAYQRAGPVDDPAHDAAIRYLLSTFSGPTAPDVVAPYRENTIGTIIPHSYGNHGGLSWGVQHVPLIMSGPGVRHGRSHTPARLVDVAPTVLRLMGLSLPQQDGIVLADALASPEEDELAAQVAVHRHLHRHQHALRQHALMSAAMDRQSGLRPLPLLPAVP